VMATGRRGLLVTAAVVAVNVALLAGLRGAYAAMGGDSDTVVLLLLAVVAAQVNLLAIWAALGQTRWLWRGVVAAAGIACLGMLLCTLEPGALTVPFVVTSIAGAVVVQGLCVAGPLAAARAFGVRLERIWADQPAPANGRASLQFSVSYLLLAVTVAALALVAARELARLKPEVRSRELVIVDAPFTETPPALLLRRVLVTWSVCAALFGLAATKVTLAARRASWAVPPAALLALAVCPLFAWLNTDTTYAWRLAIAGMPHALLVLGSLLAVRRLGYRVAPPGRPLHVLGPWIALLVLTAVVFGAWRAAKARPWLVHQAIVFEDDISGLAFSPDGALLAIQRDHRTIELRDAHTLQLETVVEGDRLLSLVAFSPDGTSLICSEDPYRGPYKAWNLAGKRWEALAKMELRIGSAVTASGRLLVADYASPGVVVRDLCTGRVVSRTALPDRVEDGVSFLQVPGDARFAPDGATMSLSIGFIAETNSRSLRDDEVWLVPLADPSRPIVLPERLNITDQTFSPTGQFVTLDEPHPSWRGHGKHHRVRFWDSRTGRELGSFAVFGYWERPALSPDGKTLALTGGRRNPVLSALLASEIRDDRGWMGYVGLWDATTGRPVRGFVVSTPARSLAFSPDGKTLAAASGNSVYLWNASF
jgi:hypothetical protein